MCVFVSTCGDTGVCVGGVCVERLRVFGGRDVCMCVWRERQSLWRERQCNVSVCVCVCVCVWRVRCVCVLSVRQGVCVGGETALCVCMEKWVCGGREIALHM